jgi:hypothetical protein
VLDLLKRGKPVKLSADNLGLGQQTADNRRTQEAMTEGTQAGLTTLGRAELAAASISIR